MTIGLRPGWPPPIWDGEHGLSTGRCRAPRRRHAFDEPSQRRVRAIGLGFIGGTILTLITAFTIGGRMSPYVGGIPDFSGRMHLTGWSQTSGDLRVSHFFATHMIQAVPVAGRLLG